VNLYYYIEKVLVNLTINR